MIRLMNEDLPREGFSSTHPTFVAIKADIEEVTRLLRRGVCCYGETQEEANSRVLGRAKVALDRARGLAEETGQPRYFYDALNEYGYAKRAAANVCLG